VLSPSAGSALYEFAKVMFFKTVLTNITSASFKIYTKTAPTYFGVITIIRERTI
jgi:hypothetical protein